MRTHTRTILDDFADKLIKRIMLFGVRINTIFTILFRPSKSWFIVYLTPEQLKDSMERKDVEDIEVSMHRLTTFNVRYICNYVTSDFDLEKEYDEMVKDFNSQTETVATAQ